ncbi:hypothetical protein QZH41_004098 [Actinostola sp. cb2023]|nr:hypothetical protein QZH41_004098 [Actinostola sp. cb2023]
MDAKPKPILKSGAIPTVFSHRPVEKKRRISSEKRREVKDKQEFLQSIFEISEAACSMGQQDVAMEAMEAMETLPDFTNLACEPHTEPSNDDNDYVPTPSTMSRAWLHEQQTVWTDIGEREVWISGDGRCDSPGFSAKYGTYTMIDQETDKIVDFKLIQVSEVGSSNQMERKGFKQCMDNLLEHGTNIKVVATDGHIGIAADMKKDYPNIQHQQDVWHISKRINKKLTEKAKKKDCNDLFPWIKSVSNHLWWCADSCEGNKANLREKWISLIYHTVNIHSWDSADVYHQCAHPPIPPHEARTKIWLKPGSPPHDALKSVVLDKNILKAVEQLNLCCHTGNLEVYHSVLTSYLPKRQHFSYKGMIARTQLVALHHNNNTNREQAVSSKGENEGELKYKIVFPKRTKEWVAKPVKTKTTRDHLKPILAAVIARKHLKYDDRTDGIDTTNVAQNIALKPRPPRNEIIAHHSSRFSRS